jgi:predicted ATPase/class 3 adenylate cyclase
MHAAHPGSTLGTLTFLFTDVEGSTPLWERHEATMRVVTARHDALLDANITEHGGQRVRERGEGDSIFAVFASPVDAVAAALVMARAVLAEPWPAETPIRVRMGLHTGLAQYRAGDYYGPAVNRCARIRGLGHGGQILLSAATAALVRGALPVGASLRPLGRHSLKGLSEPEDVSQLCHADLPGAFPPLLSPQAPKHNLPQALSAMIGREAEQGQVLALLAEARLVTLTGTGGVGKTRLALAVAAELLDQYADGVWLVELAPLADPALVVGAVAQALETREEPNRPILATLTDYLKDKHLLLVLDNCEHLIAACAELAAALLRAAPGLSLLATSREGLGVTGEQCYRVPSLSAPDPKYLPPIELVGSYEAARLFVARAQARRREFALDAQNARAVAELCARLDGIPLAIELAAARVGSLPVEAIASRLSERFRLLTGGPRDVLPRQQTLRATVDWSWELLNVRERSLLQGLSVFAGGWTLEAAEMVCTSDGTEQWEVLDLLDSLANKSLVQVDERGDGTRYRLLETVRQYAWEHLEARGDRAATQRCHLAWCEALAEEAEPHLTGPAQGAWLGRLDAEHDNLRAALDWSLGGGMPVGGLQLAGLLWRFWLGRGYLSEGRRWLEAALLAAHDVPASLKARAFLGAGVLAYEQDDYVQARARYEVALAMYHDFGDQHGAAFVLSNLGKVAWMLGAAEEARSRYDESLQLARALQDQGATARALGNLGNLAYQAGYCERARAHFEECLAIFRQVGDQQGIANAVNNLAMVALEQRDFATARGWLEENLTLAREQGAPSAVALALINLGEVASDQGDYARARMHYLESLPLWQMLGAKGRIAGCLEGLARLDALEHAAEDGIALRATRLCGAAEALRDVIRAPLSPADRPTYEATLAALRATLGEERFAAARLAGRELSLEQAVAEAPAIS